MELTQQLSLATMLSQQLHAKLQKGAAQTACDLREIQKSNPILSMVPYTYLKEVFEKFLISHYALDLDGNAILKENAGSPTSKQVREHLTKSSRSRSEKSPLKRRSYRGKGGYKGTPE